MVFDNSELKDLTLKSKQWEESSLTGNLDILQVLEFNTLLKQFDSTIMKRKLVKTFAEDRWKLEENRFTWDKKFPPRDNNSKKWDLGFLKSVKDHESNIVNQFLAIFENLDDEFIFKLMDSKKLLSILNEELIVLYMKKDCNLYASTTYIEVLNFKYKIFNFYIDYYFVPLLSSIPEINYKNIESLNPFIRNKIRYKARKFFKKDIIDFILIILDNYIPNLNYYWVIDEIPMHILILKFIELCLNYGLIKFNSIDKWVKKLLNISENLLNIEKLINFETDEDLKQKRLLLNYKTKNHISIILTHITFLYNDEKINHIFPFLTNEILEEEKKLKKEKTKKSEKVVSEKKKKLKLKNELELKQIHRIDGSKKISKMSNENFSEFIDSDETSNFIFKNKNIIKDIAFLMNNYLIDNSIEMNKYLIDNNKLSSIIKNYIYYLQKDDYYENSLINVDNKYLRYVFDDSYTLNKNENIENIEKDLEKILENIISLRYDEDFLLNFEFRKDYILILTKIVTLFEDEYYKYAIAETNILLNIFFILKLLMNSNLNETEQKIKDIIGITIFSLNKILQNNSFSQIQIFMKEKIYKMLKSNTKLNLELIVLFNNCLIKDKYIFGMNLNLFDNMFIVFKKKINNFYNDLDVSKVLNSSYSNLAVPNFELLGLCHFMNSFYESLIFNKKENRLFEINIQSVMIPLIERILNIIYKNKIKIEKRENYWLNNMLGFNRSIENTIIYYEKSKAADSDKKLNLLYDIFYYVIDLFKRISKRYYSKETKLCLQKIFNKDRVQNLFYYKIPLTFNLLFLDIYFTYNFNGSNYQCNSKKDYFYINDLSQDYDEEFNLKSEQVSLLVFEYNNGSDEILFLEFINKFLEKLEDYDDYYSKKKKGVKKTTLLFKDLLNLVLSLLNKVFKVFDYYLNDINLYKKFNEIIKRLYENIILNENLFIKIITNPIKLRYSKVKLTHIKEKIYFFEEIINEDDKNQKNKKKQKLGIKKNLKKSEKIPHLKNILHNMIEYNNTFKDEKGKKKLKTFKTFASKIEQKKEKLIEKWELLIENYRYKKSKFLNNDNNEFLLSLRNLFGINGNNLDNLIKFLLINLDIYELNFLKKKFNVSEEISKNFNNKYYEYNDNDNIKFLNNVKSGNYNYEFSGEFYLLNKELLSLIQFFYIIMEKFNKFRFSLYEIIKSNNFSNYYYLNFLKFINIYIELLLLTKGNIERSHDWEFYVKSLESMSLFLKTICSNNFKEFKVLMAEDLKIRNNINSIIYIHDINGERFEFSSLLELFYRTNYLMLSLSKYNSEEFYEINNENDEKDIKLYISCSIMLSEIINGNYEETKDVIADFIDMKFYKKLVTCNEPYILSNFYNLQYILLDFIEAFIETAKIKYIVIFQKEFIPENLFDNLIIFIKKIIVHTKIVRLYGEFYNICKRKPDSIYEYNKINFLQKYYKSNTNREVFIILFNKIYREKIHSVYEVFNYYQNNSSYFTGYVMQIVSKSYNILRIVSKKDPIFLDFLSDKINIANQFTKLYLKNRSKINTIPNINLQKSPKSIWTYELFFLTKFIYDININVQIINPFISSKKMYYTFLKVPITFFISDIQVDIFKRNLNIETTNDIHQSIVESYYEFYIHSYYGFWANKKFKAYKLLTSINSLKFYQIFLYLFSLVLNIAILFVYEIRSGLYILPPGTNKTIFTILNIIFIILNLICLVFWFIFKFIKNRRIEEQKFKNNHAIKRIRGLNIFTVYIYNSMLTDKIFLSFILHIIFTSLWFTGILFFLNCNLFLIVNFNRLMAKVVKSATLYYNYLLATFVIIVFMVYSFSILINFNFENDFNTGIINNQTFFVCVNLFECFLSTLNIGLRAGGIGEVLNFSPPADGQGRYIARYFIDFFFFFLINVIILNIISGIIIETFSVLRDQERKINNFFENICTICGEEKKDLEIKGIKYESHVSKDHNFKNYIYFLVYLYEKSNRDKLSLNNIELQILNKILKEDSSWIPIGFINDKENTQSALKKINEFFKVYIADFDSDKKKKQLEKEKEA